MELYRWIKASERYPEMGETVHVRFGAVLYCGFRKERPVSKVTYFSLHGGYEIDYIDFDKLEWLEKIELTNQEELWYDVKDIIMTNYNNYNTPHQAIKELSKSYHLIKK